jgi:acyl carrier protein
LDTLKEIQDFLLKEFAPERSGFDPEENLLASGLIDSMGILKLVTFLEEQFGFQAGDDDLVPENFMNLRLIQAFVDRKRGA